MEAGLESTLQFKLTVPPSIVDTSLWSRDTSGESEEKDVSKLLLIFKMLPQNLENGSI